MLYMRDFSWNVFSKTGDVDAYLLYKQISEGDPTNMETQEEEQVIEEPLEGLNE
jgi:hypothetical protein